jgi:hypothetical protein
VLIWVGGDGGGRFQCGSLPVCTTASKSMKPPGPAPRSDPSIDGSGGADESPGVSGLASPMHGPMEAA